MTNLPAKDQPVFSQPQTPTIIREREVPFAVNPEAQVPIVEVGKITETAAEKEGYIARVEKELVELQQAVVGKDGSVLLAPAAPQDPKIVLPIDRDSYINPKNWHKPVVEAFSWLLAWTKRIIKMNPNKTIFEQ